jgi:inner membrane transporter RhtA
MLSVVVRRKRSCSAKGLAVAPAPLLVFGGVVGLEGGAAVATTLIPLAGVPGTVALRFGFGALGLCLIARPRIRGLSADAVGLVILVGAILAAHHLCFYEAIHRLPLGVAVTLEFTGPLAVALVGFRHRSDLVWAPLAAAGVVVTVGLSVQRHINLTGVICGVVAGTCWAAYIVIFPRLASSLGRSDALSLSMLAAAIGTVPYGLAVDGDRLLAIHAILLGAAVAALSDVIAYTFQSEALSRIAASLFSILSSTEPAVGALLGLIALGQRITMWQWAGMLAVTAASVGAIRSHAASLTSDHTTTRTQG